jgi:hypothetical protein
MAAKVLRALVRFVRDARADYRTSTTPLPNPPGTVEPPRWSWSMLRKALPYAWRVRRASGPLRGGGPHVV